jgi:MoxR-like ATPase
MLMTDTSTLRCRVDELRDFMSCRILGQERLISRMLIALLADGHLLVEGMPGMAKTRAVKSMAEGLEPISIDLRMAVSALALVRYFIT